LIRRLLGTNLLNLMSTPDASLDFRVPSQANLSRVVRAAVSDFAQGHGVGADDLTHFLTALGEALANAIEHAKSDGPIEIEVRIGGGSIEATVRDSGIGFRPDRAGDAALPDPDAERGRGLPIMRRCCDIFTVESAPGRGTSVRIGRYLRARAVAGVGASDPHHAA
jgi:anti-sigma regulatory factor (Ser/Thr protein kinase)